MEIMWGWIGHTLRKTPDDISRWTSTGYPRVKNVFEGLLILGGYRN